MPTIADIRRKYPQYEDMTDLQLASALRKKHYADMDPVEYYTKIGMAEQLGLTQGTDPSAGNNIAENALEGFGRGVTELARGSKQIGLGVADLVNPRKQSVAGLVSGKPQLTRSQEYQKELDEASRLDESLMNTWGGNLGNIGAQVAGVALPGGAVTKAGMIPKALQGAKLLPSLGRAAVAGGTLGAAQPVLTGDTRTGNVATSAGLGVLGQGAVNVVGKVAKGSAHKLEPAVAELARKAEALGIPVSRAQLSDSKFVKVLASVVKSMPFSGAGNMQKTQQAAFNRAVSRTFGENAETVTADVASRAKKRLGAAFSGLSSRNTLKFDDTLINDLSAVADDAAKTGSDDNARIVKNVVDEFLSKSKDAKVSGNAYREFDTKLGQAMKSQDGDKRHYLGQVRSAIRNAMDRSISPADQAAWKSARGQYKNLKTVEDLIEKAADGNLSPALLLNMVRGANRDFAYGGGGDLADLARIGQRFLKDPIPTSGTSERGLMAGFMGGAMAPTTTLTALTAGRAANRLVNSPASGNYVLHGSATARKALPFVRPLPLLLPAAANAKKKKPR